MKPSAFDRLMGSLDRPMVIVTAAHRRAIGGCLVGFSVQCSMDPPRYCVFLSKANHTYEVARRAGHLLVHFLDRRQHELAALFGEHTDEPDPGEDEPVDKWDVVTWRPGPDGRTPRLADVDAWIFAKVVSRHDAGDHVAFILDPVRVRTPRRLRQLGYQDVRDLTAPTDAPPWRGRARDVRRVRGEPRSVD
jgi:flavin reductase (DIM6/NTAB) family NADH-FMN oxidoreductase RutF